MALSSTSAAVFLDKDGTLIHDEPYNVDPARIRLREDAAMALAALQKAGYALFLVSNQSGVADGRFPESALDGVWRYLQTELGRHGVVLSGIYYCPHGHAAGCGCRKPQAGLLQRAAQEHGVALQASWMIGDILDDVEAGRRAGCRTILLDVGSETEWQDSPWRRPDFVTSALSFASHHILSSDGKSCGVLS
jgi:histidinol-phosphate phosphatase family protein